MPWFEVDTMGFRALYAGREDKFFTVKELVQNAFDEEGVTQCAVTLTSIDRKRARLVVTDNAPEGFYDLRHAYVLFAHTRKRGNVEKRGRFNLGEKQVLSLCEHATITTTKGSVIFLPNGERKSARTRRAEGTIFEATVFLTHKDVEHISRMVQMIIPPEGILFSFNGEQVNRPFLLATLNTELSTEVADSEGNMKPTVRKADIEVYAAGGNAGHIFEMGLPIVETGDRWHYNVKQRVPMNLDRDNVRPAYLRKVRACVLNGLFDLVGEEDVSQGWVRDATKDKTIEGDAVVHVAKVRYGEKRAVYDPSNPKSREEAISEGYNVITGRELSAEEWGTFRKHEAIPSATKLFPQPKAADFKHIDPTTLSENHQKVAALTQHVAKTCAGFSVRVHFIREKTCPHSAYFCDMLKTVTFNLAKLPQAFWKKPLSEEVLDLIIHEVAHEGGGHIDKGYHSKCTQIGARLALRMYHHPEEFKQFEEV